MPDQSADPASVCTEIPEELLGDLRVLKQKYERFVFNVAERAPYSVVRNAQSDLLRAVFIMFEYLPAETSATPGTQS